MSLKDDPYFPDYEIKYAGDMITWPKVGYEHIIVCFSQKADPNAQEILDNDPGHLGICSGLLTGVQLDLQYASWIFSPIETKDMPILYFKLSGHVSSKLGFVPGLGSVGRVGHGPHHISSRTKKKRNICHFWILHVVIYILRLLMIFVNFLFV